MSFLPSEYPNEDAAESSVRVLEATQKLLQNEMLRERRARGKIILGIESMSKAVLDLQRGLDGSKLGAGRESIERESVLK